MAKVKLITRFFEIEDANLLPIYEANGGYAAARKVVTESWPPDKIFSTVKAANLRGLGGAGFPAGMKWSFVPKDAEGPKYLVVNADESEPGTFKDRHIMLKAPHLLLEGAIIAACSINAEDIYIYVRGEYYQPTQSLERAIEEAEDAGFLGKNIFGSHKNIKVHLHRGAGAYICGEETALLSSLEGFKGWPKLKPPFPAVKGLFSKPTIINNVETLSYVPIVIDKGPEYFAKLGVERNGGARLFGISGHVKKPGVYELSLGTPMRELIFDHAGGVRGDRKLKAVIPGGSSCPVLTADEIDVNLDFDSLAKIGSMLGSGGMIIMDETTDMVKVLLRICRFYAFESCGQCTPCREGTGWMTRIMERVASGEGTSQDLDDLYDVAGMIGGNTICPLGDAASLPVLSFVKKFRAEFEAKVSAAKVPAASGKKSAGEEI
ncbi:MAG: NADH oxidoreductase (quinone) subunit F [Candidatus Glassbacteria bacterium RIFCSPLOWO2_12_FULL_58_11]|uniref:NADH-quinone oxidoreductase subunit F n=2 Tax=Candidatus Glassiibacteriota TaxID=1817805 RepID=A0A1F5Z0I2_9BACT|nr:MAG: NADH oxidoreductase (quinone) subunit F [Candidatus Glassbacteria bacterium RIFCSPLOWO2_12_FULL_58_11]